MATLPTRSAIVSVTTTNAQQKVNLGDQRDFIADLLGTDSADKAAARTALGLGNLKQLVQTAASLSGAVATGSTQIPIDDTIPQITEGNEYFNIAYTPLSATNILKIKCRLYICNSGSGNLVGALFQDSTANALVAGTLRNESTGFPSGPLYVEYSVVAGSTTARTYRLRAGAGAAGTSTVNGAGGVRMLGGVLVSGMTIEEYTP